MNRTYHRGDMYYADLGRGIGSEQEGYRPVLIIQNDTGNKHSATVIRRAKRKLLPRPTTFQPKQGQQTSQAITAMLGAILGDFTRHP